MNAISRNERYLSTGAGAGLVRVEVLVPADGREPILALAKELRDQLRPSASKDAAARTLQALRAITIEAEFRRLLGAPSDFSLDAFARALANMPNKVIAAQFRKLQKSAPPKMLADFISLYGVTHE